MSYAHVTSNCLAWNRCLKNISCLANKLTVVWLETIVWIGKLTVISVLAYFVVMSLTIIAIMSTYLSYTRQHINDLLFHLVLTTTMKQVLFFSFYRWGNQGSEKLHNFSKVTQQAGTSSGLESKLISLFSLHHEKDNVLISATESPFFCQAGFHQWKKISKVNAEFYFCNS